MKLIINIINRYRLRAICGLVQYGKDCFFIEEIVADFLLSITENRNLGIVLAYQINISIDINLSPVYRLPVTVENH